MIGAQRVDFVSILVTDKERAMQFYGETLGLERDSKAHADWPAQLGNVTIAIVVPAAIGWPMVNTPPGAIAIRVPDVADARAKLEEAGVEFTGDTFDSGVCHMAFFMTRTGTGLLHHCYAPFSDGHDALAHAGRACRFRVSPTQDPARPGLLHGSPRARARDRGRESGPGAPLRGR